MSKSIQLKNSENERVYPHPYYPIGSIYLSVNNINPSEWFGGTWEQIAKGRTLVGVDTNDTDFNTVKKTGGSKYLQEHKHIKNTIGWTGDGGFWVGNGTYTTLDFAKDKDVTGSVSNLTTGNSGNLQPYFTCYIWCRIA